MLKQLVFFTFLGCSIAISAQIITDPSTFLIPNKDYVIVELTKEQESQLPTSVLEETKSGSYVTLRFNGVIDDNNTLYTLTGPTITLDNGGTSTGPIFILNADRTQTNYTVIKNSLFGGPNALESLLKRTGYQKKSSIS